MITNAPAMALDEACKLFIYHNERINDRKTVEHYSRAVREFSELLKRPATIEDLSDDNVLALMRDCIARGLSPQTANHRRKCLCSLWRWLAQRRMVERFPCVRKLKEPVRTPRAWTRDELLRLIRACRETKGIIGGVAAAEWWLAFHAVCWDTAERTSALLSLEWKWLDMDSGILSVPASVRKGKVKDAVYQLAPDTIDALRKIVTPHPLVFFGVGHRSGFWGRYDTLLRRAGLPHDRYCKPQKLRRSHASWLKKAGGDPTTSLGHDSDVTTRQSYLDPTVIEETPSSMLFRILDAPPLEEPPITDERRRLIEDAFDIATKRAESNAVQVDTAAALVRNVKNLPSCEDQRAAAYQQAASWPGCLLTKHQVADMAGLSAQTVSGYASCGKLPSIKVGTKVRFDAAEVEKWIEARKQKAEAAEGEVTL